MNFTDFTQLLLGSTRWLFIGLICYYILSFCKVHLLWKIQSRIWNHSFHKNIFKGYFLHLLQAFFTDFLLHKMTFTYIFRYSKKKFPLEDSDKTKGIINRINILESLTLFLKPFLFFALLFAGLRFWISKRFLYEELTITLGEIQKLLNTLDSFAITRILNGQKALVFFILGCITVFIPYLYVRNSLHKKIKRRLKYGILSIAILTNISFFGTLTGETISQKTEELSTLTIEITDIHDRIYKELFLENTASEIETALEEEEALYLEIYKSFEKKISTTSKDKNRDAEIQAQLVQKLSSKLKELEKFTFNIGDFNTNDQKTYEKSSKNSFSFYGDVKNEKAYASYKNYQEYIGSKEKWNKNRGTSLAENLKNITTTLAQNSFKDKLKKILGHIVDYGYEITASLFFEELDISSQKTLKKVLSIVIKENILKKINDKIARSIDNLSSPKQVKEIIQTTENAYSYSKENIKDLSKENLDFYNEEVSNAQKQQAVIDRNKLLKKLDQKIYAEVNQMINSFDMVTNISTNEYTQYKKDIVNAYKKDLQLEKIPTRQINEILTATTAMQLKIKRFLNQSNSTTIVTHPGPAETCPICAFYIATRIF